MLYKHHMFSPRSTSCRSVPYAKFAMLVSLIERGMIVGRTCQDSAEQFKAIGISVLIVGDASG
jgi:hypothetical protein